MMDHKICFYDEIWLIIPKFLCYPLDSLKHPMIFIHVLVTARKLHIKSLDQVAATLSHMLFLTLMHSEWPELHRVLVVLNAKAS